MLQISILALRVACMYYITSVLCDLSALLMNVHGFYHTLSDQSHYQQLKLHQHFAVPCICFKRHNVEPPPSTNKFKQQEENKKNKLLPWKSGTKRNLLSNNSLLTITKNILSLKTPSLAEPSSSMVFSEF